MTLSLEEVDHIARLARLALSDEEKARYAAQLSSILDYARRLLELNTKDIPPTFNVLPAGSSLNRSQVLREDETEPGLEADLLLRNAPEVQNGMFRVPPVFD